LHIDEQHTTTRVQIDSAASSIQEHTTNEHEKIRAQGVKFSEKLEEQIQAVLVEQRGSAAGTSSTLDEIKDVLAAVQRQGESIAKLC